ncbi:MAG: hypothetical protein CML81_00080 [Rhodobiaceae bacterium]|nr:hypothetical protein [Rhodobiaceae bacterium]RPF98075.1 MAG: hypothetical protein CBD87_000075 [Rhizobiales bacterium TMED227]|tara:strand:+ start:677 stop:1768 length:1092 start_codon:yes stop_codon:yes gene_type:complete
MTKAAELAKMGEVLTNSQIGGRRNMFFNPKALVAQRGTTSIAAGTAGYGALDRYRINNGSTAVTNTIQATTVPTGQGFSNSIHLDVTTADTSLTSGVQFLFTQRFEGQDLQHLKKGTSSAETTVLSFWVRSAKSGTHIVELFDTDNSRHINKAYTVSSADTWEHKEITIEGDTTGAFTNDVNTSLEVTWHLAAGSNFTSGTLQTSWGSRTDANRAVGQVNVLDSTDNNFYLTGIQWELGSQATPFEHRSLGEELALCQRYYYDPNVGTSGTLDGNLILVEAFGTGCVGAFQFPVTMRSTPTVSIFGRKDTEAGKIRVTNTGAYVGGSAVATNIGPSGFGFVASLSGLSSDEVYDCTYKADAEL